METFSDIVELLSNITGFTSGTLELGAALWGFLQLIIDTVGGLAEAITNLFG